MASLDSRYAESIQFSNVILFCTFAGVIALGSVETWILVMAPSLTNNLLTSVNLVPVCSLLGSLTLFCFILVLFMYVPYFVLD